MGIAFIVIIDTINLKLFFLLHTVSGKLEESYKFFFLIDFIDLYVFL